MFTYNVTKKIHGGIIMSKFCGRRTKKKIGTVVAAVGGGIVLSMLIPFWGWIMAMGGVIIVAGWKIMESNDC